MKNPSLCYGERLKIAFQYAMPQYYLTMLAGWFAKQNWGAVTHFAIKLFAKKYNVDMNEAGKPNFSDYLLMGKLVSAAILTTNFYCKPRGIHSVYVIY